MCLGDVAEVRRLLPDGRAAVVRSGSRTGTVSLLTLDDPVAVGDWVLCHSGFALHRLTPLEAQEATELRGLHTPVDPTAVEATTTEEER